MYTFNREEYNKRMEWYLDARFGMFIHWGLYSIPARGEWVRSEEEITKEEYMKYFDEFDPVDYDPRAWARAAKEAGMKYVVLTAKHHDGFCLFDSQYTDFKSTNTKCRRDLVKEYVEAVRAEGLKVGIYFTIIDWYHDDYPHYGDRQHPMRNNPAYKNDNRNFDNYLTYMHNQIREICTNYGKIDILWFDFSYDGRDGEGAQSWMKGKGKNDWEADKLIATARSLQPDIIIDNRTDIEQDLWTPEQYQPVKWVTHQETGELVTWEACQTFSGSWGYYRDEQTWKSPEMLIRMLVNTVSCGGNLLMNVGPTSRGYLDYRAEEALKVYADWMKYNSRSIYGCTMAEPEFTAPADCRYTQSVDGSRLYLHMFAYPFAHLRLPGLAGKVKYAQFLHDGSEVLYTEGSIDHFSAKDENGDAGDLILYLPPVKPHTLVPVIELILE